MRAVEPLIAVFRKTGWYVDLLVELRDPHAVDVLLEKLDLSKFREGDDSLLKVIQALGLIADERAESPLRKALKFTHIIHDEGGWWDSSGESYHASPATDTDVGRLVREAAAQALKNILDEPLKSA